MNPFLEGLLFGDTVGNPNADGNSHCSWRSTTPWVNIAFDCQKCQNSTPTYDIMDGLQHQTRVYGEASEDNWNVIVIKPKSRIINIIGFNEGSDFNINY